MITKLSHSCVFVLSQDSAKEFYVDKLGFALRNDMTMGEGGFRWLTVSPPEQPGVEIILMEPGPPQHDPETERSCANWWRRALGAGAWETADCRKTYEVLSARGVTFLQAPAERPYGIEALFRDDSGNWFSLTERTEFDPDKEWASGPAE